MDPSGAETWHGEETARCTVASDVGWWVVEGTADVVTRVDITPHRLPLREARGGAVCEGARQLGAYFEGKLQRFDLPLSPSGTPFQRRVWTALLDIPYGHTSTYGEIAAALGQPTASRAVGAANGRNPIGVVVPCHRVIGKSGALVGYAGGLDTKRFLLDLERRVAPTHLA